MLLKVRHLLELKFSGATVTPNRVPLIITRILFPFGSDPFYKTKWKQTSKRERKEISNYSGLYNLFYRLNNVLNWSLNTILAKQYFNLNAQNTCVLFVSGFNIVIYFSL